ncbi:transient receptor potential cation channel subfamily M member-like 2 [Glandiceps talaboti]
MLAEMEDIELIDQDEGQSQARGSASSDLQTPVVEASHQTGQQQEDDEDIYSKLLKGDVKCLDKVDFNKVCSSGKLVFSHLYKRTVVDDTYYDRTSTRDILRMKLYTSTLAKGCPEESFKKEMKWLLLTLTKGQLYEYVPDVANNPYKHLFIWAVLTNKLTLAKLFWKKLRKDYIGAALTAGGILKTLAEEAKVMEDVTLYLDLLQHAKEFEEIAVNVLERCYKDDRKASKLLIVRVLNDWCQSTCASIAYQTCQMKFLTHDCCLTKFQTVWLGYMQLCSKRQWLLFYLGLVPPLGMLLVFFMTFLRKDYKVIAVKVQTRQTDELDANLLKTNENTPRNMCDVRLHNWRRSEKGDVGWREAWRYYYKAPITKYMHNVLSYIILLALFTTFLLSDLRPASEPNSPSIVECIVITWVISILIEDLRQVFTQEQSSFHFKFMSWLSYFGNKADLWNFVLFTTSLLLRFILPPSVFPAARVVYSVTFIFFCLRLLHSGFASKDIGPKVYMIYKMLHDLSHFLFILVIFMLGFGIATEAILYPNMKPRFEILVKSLYRPYWQLYGELFLDEIEGLIDNDTCHTDPRYLNTCPQVEEYRWVAPTLTAIYVLISNVLLMNLLIAMFSFTFQKVQDNAETISRFYRYAIINEHEQIPALPPPFVIINHIWMVICYLYGRIQMCASCRCRGSGKRFQRNRSTALRLWLRDDTEMNTFEQSHVQGYYNEIIKDDAIHKCTENNDHSSSVRQTMTPKVCTNLGTLTDASNNVTLKLDHLLQLHTKINKLEDEIKEVNGRLQQILEIIKPSD